MTRTTDDLHESERFQPLGSPTRQPTPSTPPHSKPVGPYGVVTMPDGTIRTTRDNLPRIVPEMLPDADDFDIWGMLP
jgi:hypothetical protein